jgi:endo-1,4-beta-xylanase
MQVTVAGNACKWAGTEPSQNVYNYTACTGDQEIARGLGVTKFRLHNLMWGNDNPDWLVDLAANATSDQLASVLVSHIAHVVGAAGASSIVTDVVNEPFCNEPSECFPSDGWFKNTTWWPALHDPLETAFTAAAAARKAAGAPHLGLFVNDYSLLESGFKLKRVVAAITALKAKGVPVEGVGIQAHVDLSPDPVNMMSSIKTLVDLGMRVQITENDVKCGNPCTGSLAASQAQTFGNILTACLAHMPTTPGGPGCEAHITWGFTDLHSWLNKAGDITNPLPFDANYQPKPAALELLSVLQHWAAGMRDPTRPWAYAAPA